MNHPIEPRFISQADVLTTFDFIHRAMSKDLKDNRDIDEVKVKLSYFANSYVNSYKPTKHVLRKYNVSNKLRNNKYILIRRPDEGNRVAIVERWLYMSRMYDIVNIASRFLKLSADPTLRRKVSFKEFYVL